MNQSKADTLLETIDIKIIQTPISQLQVSLILYYQFQNIPLPFHPSSISNKTIMKK